MRKRENTGKIYEESRKCMKRTKKKLIENKNFDSI